MAPPIRTDATETLTRPNGGGSETWTTINRTSYRSHDTSAMKEAYEARLKTMKDSLTSNSWLWEQYGGNYTHTHDPHAVQHRSRPISERESGDNGAPRHNGLEKSVRRGRKYIENH
mmetsp:Transcript_20349/g.24406  ORF Transcript_20349/g.24406 Transcript_20349/m.24406 type:complete len:116 (+) Transcript_20349:99-446(+)|eukprot:CAMPEP_0197848138 /NCGR_PEP_ID=MMETSP1438-20131217/7947_1 /TAXON_ID=1461541 /ORGANISM="Pterosperma sp., Strain CCMP1384" /LENGTH=115 /DNA_ID=CAMNT_0043460277 /DNA_START=92 /DNA_END=439 /DNA_ORIENTATION=+